MPPFVTDAELMELRHQVHHLTDRADIETLVHRLGACLDEARFDGFDQIFTPDAVARTPGGAAEGRAAMAAQASRNHSSEERIQHAISDVLVDVNGDQATVRANLHVVFAHATEPGPRLAAGQVYRFGARRTETGWRLSSVETSMLWKAEPPARTIQPDHGSAV